MPRHHVIQPGGPPQQTAAAVGVLVVDDQAIFRTTASAVIEATAGFVALGEADSGSAALDLLGELDPALVLLDVRMPEMDGIETAQRIAAAHPHVVVVLISVEDPADLAPLAAGCGAAALVAKRDLGPPLLRRLWALHRPLP